MDIGNKEAERARKDNLLMALYQAGPAALLDDMRSLHVVMDHELTTLADKNIAPLQKNEETKRTLIERMQIYTAIIKERPEWALALPEHHREELRELRTSMDKKGEELLLNLTKMRRLHDVIMRAIRKSVNQSIKAQGGYGESGMQGVSSNGTLPFSLSERC